MTCEIESAWIIGAFISGALVGALMEYLFAALIHNDGRR